MNIIFFSLITALCYGVHDYIISKPSRTLSISTLLLCVVVANIFFLTCTLFLTQTQIEFHAHTIYVLLASISGYGGFYFFSQAIKYGKIGISSSIANSYPIITLIIWYIFLGEFLNQKEIIFFLCVIVWLVFSSFHIEELRSRKLKNSKIWILFAFGAMITWSWYVTFFDLSVNNTSVLLTSWYLDIFALFLLLPLFFVKRKNILSECKSINKSMFFYITVLSVCLVIWMLSLGYAFSLGDLALVAAIAACSPAVTTLLARIFEKEKLDFTQYIAITILIFGICGLSYLGS